MIEISEEIRDKVVDYVHDLNDRDYNRWTKSAVDPIGPDGIRSDPIRSANQSARTSAQADSGGL